MLVDVEIFDSPIGQMIARAQGNSGDVVRIRDLSGWSFFI